MVGWIQEYMKQIAMSDLNKEILALRRKFKTVKLESVDIEWCGRKWEFIVYNESDYHYSHQGGDYQPVFVTSYTNRYEGWGKTILTAMKDLKKNIRIGKDR